MGATMIAVNDKIKDVNLLDKNNKVVKLSSITRDKNTLLIFFPKDFSLFCTKQICMLRDNFSKFNRADLKVIGVSRDSAKSHEKFIADYQIPFQLYSDPNGKALKELGFKDSLGIIPPRVSILIDEDLVCRMVYSSQIDIVGHFNKAVSAIKEL